MTPSKTSCPDNYFDHSIPIPAIISGEPVTAVRYIRTHHPVSQKAARLAVRKRMKK